MKKYTYSEIERLSYHSFIKLMFTELSENGIKSKGVEPFYFSETNPSTSFGGALVPDYRAIEFLKSSGLLNNGICPFCGKRPIDSNYTFTNGYNQAIKFHICKGCYKEGVRSSSNPNNNEGCFIATLCYGSYDAYEVVLLRDFRDNYLKKSTIGCLFIHFYYYTSPQIVNLLKSHKKTTRFIKEKFLDNICLHLEKRKKGSA